MRKSLRSKIRALKCPRITCSDAALPVSTMLETGFNDAVQTILKRMDENEPPPSVLYNYINDNRDTRVATIVPYGAPLGVVVYKAGYIEACTQMAKLVYEKHHEEIEWVRNLEQAAECGDEGV